MGWWWWVYTNWSIHTKNAKNERVHEQGHWRIYCKGKKVFKKLIMWLEVMIRRYEDKLEDYGEWWQTIDEYVPRASYGLSLKG